MLSHYARHIYDTLFFLLFDQDVFVLKIIVYLKKIFLCVSSTNVAYVIFSVYLLAFAYYIGL